MASLYLIRHAEPQMTGRLLGQVDSPLSPSGSDYAALALREIRVSVAWTSPLLRARETAAALNATRVVELAGLREIDQGEWSGRSWAEIERQWPAQAKRKLDDWIGVAAPGGESWTSFVARVRDAWTTIREGPPDSAVVAHVGVNSALAYLIDGRDPLKFTQGYGEVIRVAYD